MILVILNPYSQGAKAKKIWKELSSLISHDQVLSLQDFIESPPSLNEGDQIYCAGGDGGLHSVVNTLINHIGVENLSRYSVGYIGLGSNNSFIQPTNLKRKINNIPVQIGPEVLTRDLIEVSFKDPTPQRKFIVSNASLGLLSYANQTFNQNKFVQFLKMLSITAADVASFIITLMKYQNLQVSINGASPIAITNLHWLKSPYFTKDLHFPIVSLPNEGAFDFFNLKGKTFNEVFTRFMKMQLFQNMNQGFEEHQKIQTMEIKTPALVPFEMDGEIYYGQEFSLKVHKAVLKVLT